MAGKIPPQFKKHLASAAKKKVKKNKDGTMMTPAQMKAEHDKKLPPWLQKKGK